MSSTIATRKILSIVLSFLICCSSTSRGLAASTSLPSGFPSGESFRNTFSVDSSSGALRMSIPVPLPRGRGGLTPQISLEHTPSIEGLLATGWDLQLGKIERSTKFGPPSYTNDDLFILHLPGETHELVPISENEYRPRIDGRLLKAVHAPDNSWTVIDPSGTQYRFGITDAGRAKNATGTFSWKMERVRDVHGNIIVIENLSGGDIDVRYVLKAGLDPDTADLQEPLNFAYQARLRMGERPDPSSDHRPGFPVERKSCLKRIEILGQGHLIRAYAFAYTTSPRTGRSLLKKIDEVGADGAASRTWLSFEHDDEKGTFSAIPLTRPVPDGSLWGFRIGEKGEVPIDQPLLAMTSSSWTQNGKTVFWRLWPSRIFEVRGTSSASCLLSSYLFVDTAREIPVPLQLSNAQAEVFINGKKIADPQRWPLSQGQNSVAFLIQGTGSWKVEMGDFIPRTNSIGYSLGVMPILVADFNGDGRADLGGQYEGRIQVSLSRGQSFEEASTWAQGIAASQQVFPGDINSDGLADIVLVDNLSGDISVMVSKVASFGQPQTILNAMARTGNVSLADINGDGRSDLLNVRKEGDAFILRIFLNRAAGFREGGSVRLEPGTGFQSPSFPDLNGDGLSDVVFFKKESGTLSYQLNLLGFSASRALEKLEGFAAGKDILFTDLNDDGRTDIAYFEKESGAFQYRSWDPRGIFREGTVAIPLLMAAEKKFFQFADMNGDGATDIYASILSTDGKDTVLYSRSGVPDLLRALKNLSGGEVRFRYKYTPDIAETKMPVSFPVVVEETLSTAQGDRYVTSYDYKKGLWDPLERSFLGFAESRAVGPLGNYDLFKYHQDFHRKGRVFYQGTFDASNRLGKESLMIWDVLRPLQNALSVGIPVVSREETTLIDEDGARSRTRREFSYDPLTGLLLEERDLGEVDPQNGEDTGDDLLVKTTEYANNPLKWLLGLPAHESLKDQNGRTLAEVWFGYDGGTPGETPDKGLLTSQEVLNVTGEVHETVREEMAYDIFGQPVSAQDAVGEKDRVTRDPVFGLFPIFRTNALGHETKIDHVGVGSSSISPQEAPWGAPFRTTDPRGTVRQTILDPFGR
ncbi:MAG: hypothetical protein GX606_02785, partial [Elusimicrobia bacterium]|nr:hypothetical protein [Elusimicrobiota bacterium]